jgi:hypothetical protein
LVTATPAANGSGPAAQRPDRQAFWSLVVAAPVVLSVLRLWIEAGGELQTTLLLVANVDPINLVAAFLVTASWLASSALVAVFAIGGVLCASPHRGVERTFFARWRADAPPWFTVGSFLVAALTWQILYLPSLMLAACAAFQITPWKRPVGWRLGLAVAGLCGYGVTAWPTIDAAYHQGESLAVLLLVAPPLLALFIAGPVADFLVRPFALVAHAGVAALMLWAAVPFVTTPVLPLTVLVAGESGAPDSYVRGHVIFVDDVHTVVLRERGGVEYVPNTEIRAQVLCPSDEETPRFRLWVRAVHVEDSVLKGIGRTVRPTVREPPECRVELGDGS